MIYIKLHCFLCVHLDCLSQLILPASIPKSTFIPTRICLCISQNRILTDHCLQINPARQVRNCHVTNFVWTLLTSYPNRSCRVMSLSRNIPASEFAPHHPPSTMRQVCLASIQQKIPLKPPFAFMATTPVPPVKRSVSSLPLPRTSISSTHAYSLYHVSLRCFTFFSHAPPPPYVY